MCVSERVVGSRRMRMRMRMRIRMQMRARQAALAAAKKKVARRALNRRSAAARERRGPCDDVHAGVCAHPTMPQFAAVREVCLC